MIRAIREHEFAFDPSRDDQQLLQQVVMFYHDRLKDHAPAQDFLRQRGLTESALIERHQIGFADRSLAALLPVKQVKAGRELRKRLARLGILRASGHGHFNGCIVVPIRDESGTIVDIRGRKITKGLRPVIPACLGIELRYWPGAQFTGICRRRASGNP